MAAEPPSTRAAGLDPQFDTDAAPRVSTAPTLWPVMLGLLGALALGTIIFLQLSANRTRIEEARLTDAARDVAPLSTAGVPPPPDMSAFVNAQPPPPPAPEPLLPVADPLPPAPPPGPSQAEIDRLRAPAMIVDIGEYKAPVLPTVGPNGEPINPAAIAGAMAGAAPGGPGDKAGAGLKTDERFAQRLGVGDSGKPARATAQIALPTTVVEGTLIPAVLETALNSDLPGYLRAVVSRDVRGFDGAQVLIPRGTRLIGQYNSGVALGQSRAFVIWTRLIRPDGVAVDLASPATDALGRGGLDGDVNRHFLQRFGGAVLLTLLNLGVNAATDASDTSVVIASTRAGTDAVGVALSKDMDIPPTVTVPQGSPVRVFVSQDLDFSDVGPVASEGGQN
jgi:type IV secretory pathway VirB10-like protein